MAADILFLVLGLILLVKGGDLFVSSSVRVAEFLNMPRVVIGSTLVSLATTCPELVVSIMSGTKGESGLAVGNAIGSCICNIALIIGTSAAIRRIPISVEAYKTPLVAMFGSGILLFALCGDLRLSKLHGWMMIAAGALYFAFDFQHHIRVAGKRERAKAATLESELIAERRWLLTRAGTAAQFIFGAGVVIIGSKFLVDSAVSIASALKVPSIFVGLTIVAVGTSLPEFITALTSSKQNVSDLSVGNVLGANIANLTLIVGLAALISDVTMSKATLLFNFPAMLLVMGILLQMMLTDRAISRKEGIVLLAFYLVYIAGLISLTLVEAHKV